MSSQPPSKSPQEQQEPLVMAKLRLQKMLHTDPHWSLHCSRENLAGLLDLDSGWGKRKDSLLGRTALMNAAEKADIERVRLLLPVSDVSDQDDNGITALMLAAEKHSLDCVRELVPGSDATQTEDNGNTALMVALSAFRQILAFYQTRAFDDALECVRLLVPGSPMEQQCKMHLDGNGEEQTALMMAAAHSETADFLKILLPHCSPEVIRLQDEDGADALVLALKHGCEESVRLLAPLSDLSARVESDGVQERTALMCAAWSSSASKMRSVLQQCSPEVCQLQDALGNDALMLSVGSQDEENLAELIAKSDLSHQNAFGQTALMQALEIDPEAQSTKHLLQMLISHSTPDELRINNVDGDDVFQLALIGENLPVLNALARIATEEEAQVAIDRFGAQNVPQLMALVERRALERILGGTTGSPREEVPGAPQNKSAVGDARSTLRTQDAHLSPPPQNNPGSRGAALQQSVPFLPQDPQPPVDGGLGRKVRRRL